jgi:hypothetical protein
VKAQLDTGGDHSIDYFAVPKDLTYREEFSNCQFRKF